MNATMTQFRCTRCGRRPRDREDFLGWNGDFRQGVVVAIICGNCQTPEENAEAEINLATSDYGVDAFGRPIMSPKGVR